MNKITLYVAVLSLVTTLPPASSQTAISGSETDLQTWTDKRTQLVEQFKQNISNEQGSKVEGKSTTPFTGTQEKRDLSGVNTADLYKLSIGDQISITVYGKEHLNRIAAIDNYGKIKFNYINTVIAAGKSLPELQQTITEALEEYFKHIDVIIAPHVMSSQYFTMAGSIQLPGRKPIASKTTLLSAISEAGGLMNSTSGLSTVPITDLERSFIIRDNNHLPLSFDRLILHGDMTQNVQIKSGDFIYLPYNTAKRVNILGEVNNPREHLLRRRTTLVQLMSHAQGRTPRASSNLLIIRGSLSDPKTLEVDFDDIIAGEAKDIYLKAGDIVYVPERDYIFGEELIRGAINTFVVRIASEAGSETFREVKDTDRNNQNDFIFNEP